MKVLTKLCAVALLGFSQINQASADIVQSNMNSGAGMNAGVSPGGAGVSPGGAGVSPV